MKNNLLYVLLGVLLASGAFFARDAFDAFHRLDQRVSHIEGYLGQLSRMMQSGGR